MEQLSFSDLFNKSLLAMMGTAERLSPLDILFNILMSFLVGMFIFYIYKKTFQGVLYQRSFNVSLIVSSMVTSLIIMTISGNLVLSLGMVGALSIVRFRTPVKDSMDLVFLFWAISVGIANGVGYYNISILGTILISLILLFLTRKEEVDHPYLLIIQAPLAVQETEIFDAIRPSVHSMRLKSKVLSDGFLELTLEIKLKGQDSQFMNDLEADKKLTKATLISYSGELSSV